eukprot:m.155055 g.155055  ORF g.155055 m.155055 type:complete len:540 (+) comp17925_c0_seq2:238-1857(+)
MFSSIPFVDNTAMVSLQRTRIVCRAHDDDIHGLVPLPGRPNDFVSGSKDTRIKLWSQLGAECRESFGGSRRGSYKNWITALETNDTRIFSATRDGIVDCWDHTGQHCGGISVDNANDAPISKQRNRDRVHCLVSLQRQIPGFADDIVIAGMARQALFWNWDTNRVTGTSQVHTNDWLYAMLHLDGGDVPTFALVIGSALEVHKLHLAPKPRFQKVCDIWGQQRTCGTNQRNSRSKRPHIASIVRVSERNLAGGCFDGVVRVFDVHRNKCTQELSGHRERVWDVVAMPAMGPGVIASGADDCSLFLWDIRSPQPRIFKDTTFPGRVSSLLAVDAGRKLIAASCANDPHASRDKGCLYVFDVRNQKTQVLAQTTDIPTPAGRCDQSSDGWSRVARSQIPQEPPTESLARLSIAPQETRTRAPFVQTAPSHPPLNTALITSDEATAGVSVPPPVPDRDSRRRSAETSDACGQETKRPVVHPKSTCEWHKVQDTGKRRTERAHQHGNHASELSCGNCGKLFRTTYKGPLPRCRACFRRNGSCK